MSATSPTRHEEQAVVAEHITEQPAFLPLPALPAALGEEVDNGRGRPAIIATNPESNKRLIAVRNGQVSGPSSPKEERPVSWKDLPHKWQLFVLTMARLSEPLTQTGLSAYLFFQLKSFDPSLSDSTIASQAGIMQGCFTGAQFFTAMLWGRAADSEWIGRKKVLLIGLFGTCLSCVGFGFSRTCLQAAVFRTLGGALNGNIGVMRTMISEIVKEKKFQSRAFLLMPMCFNIGVIIGPVLGGFLADPVGNYPHLFGENSLFGGKDGVWWMKHWPYALPNLISAVFLFSASAAVFFALDETLESLDKHDFGRKLGLSIKGFCGRLTGRRNHNYTAIAEDDDACEPLASRRSVGAEAYDLEAHTPITSPGVPLTPSLPRRRKGRLPLRKIWTKNLITMLAAYVFLALHMSTFSNLWFVFLSTARFDPAHPLPPSHTIQSLPFGFTGGLGMPPRSVGFAMAVIGILGITLQLAVYPPVHSRFGLMSCYRWSLLLFPISYCLAPYLALVPSSVAPPAQASGFLVWAAIACVLFVQVLARTFALPANIILVNGSSPHPSVLGTVHGIAQSASCAARTAGPMLGGWLYGVWLKKGVVGGVWWVLAGVAACGWALGGYVREGDGHEIWLEGEKEEEAERERVVA